MQEAKLESNTLDPILIDTAIETACSRIAPNWPLDSSIAVNPFWGWRNTHYEEVAKSLETLSSAYILPRPESFKDVILSESISDQHIAKAITEVDPHFSINKVKEIALSESSKKFHLKLLSEFSNQATKSNRSSNKHPWLSPHREQVLLDSVSKFCAAFFNPNALTHTESSLYEAWLDWAPHQKDIQAELKGVSIKQRLDSISKNPKTAIHQILISLDIHESQIEGILLSCLLKINGWAAWCSYLSFQASLQQEEDNTLVDLLAIQLVIESLFDDGNRGKNSVFQEWKRHLNVAIKRSDHDVSARAILLRAMEIQYQESLITNLSTHTQEHSEPCSVQAVFCIDVRSEVFRRALETENPNIQTMGFAGFFGLPISYNAIGTQDSVAHLPGPLAPTLHACDSSGNEERDTEIAAIRKKRLDRKKVQQLFNQMPSSSFSIVEAFGLGYLYKLLKNSVSPSSIKNSFQHKLKLSESKEIRPVLSSVHNLEQQIDLAHKILSAMSLKDNFAPIVALIGHGSESKNNPHASSLECGACCGQKGDVNARVLAHLLNDIGVRSGLHQMDIHIPEDTIFIAGIHNTTTESVEIYDDDIPSSHSRELLFFKEALLDASTAVRKERLPKLGYNHTTTNPAQIEKRFTSRSRDWSQTRPEWGLANNASFIVAPRSITRGLNLEGRTFLHDYEYTQDTDNTILELIMTAPMVVTNWINMQYFASTVDNFKYGSGNKVLHNVVGGNLGVFEGNGGDLRIGLSKQSVHNGKAYMHTPLRLSVFIRAERESIEAIISKHKNVEDLINNEWLYLFRLDPITNKIEQYCEDVWIPK